MAMGGSSGPFFLAASESEMQSSSSAPTAIAPTAGTTPAATAAIDTAVRGLGYDLVAVDRIPGGLLRVTIDFAGPGDETSPGGRSIGVADCEVVTRQLQHVLEVEGVAYQRLEVSSPGLDRPLRGERDFVRFSGAQVEVTLKAPFHGRRHWRGELQRTGDGWRIVLPPPPKAVVKAGPRKAPAAPAAPGTAPTVEALDFSLADVREARLVPTIDFKGRRTP